MTDYSETHGRAAPPANSPLPGIDLATIVPLLTRRWKLLLGAPLLASVLALGASYLVSPTFTARTSFMAPQQQQSAAAGALASLGALAGMAGGGIRTTGDQYLALLKSRTVADRLIERFDLQNLYDAKFRVDTRAKLDRNTHINLGKKDGLIVVEVEDTDPKRAAEMATAYVDELRKLSASLALTEAQQRRQFFEGQLAQVRDKLTAAQQALQSTGVTAGALKAEPKATAEGFARLKAELTTAEIKLQVLRRGLADSAPEVQAQSAVIAALRSELRRLEEPDASNGQASYIGAYREFKYQESLFDLIARQYELAKVDESRDGGQLQLVDAAQVPERKSNPKRSQWMLTAFFAALAATVALVLVQHIRRSR